VLEAFAAGVGEAPQPRVLLNKALEIGDGIVEALRAHPASDRVELAGSARRLADSVKDLDIIATASDPPALLAPSPSSTSSRARFARRERRAGAHPHRGPVDLRVVEPDQFGNLLQHFTGSKAHNLALREAAVRRGLHVSEYGCSTTPRARRTAARPRRRSTSCSACRGSRPSCARTAASWRSPTASCRSSSSRADLKGDLHMHTTLSDGRADAEAMALRARELGLEYIAITDHSATHGFGNHVTPDALRAQIEEVRALDERIEGIRVLIGTETNIGTDGSPTTTTTCWRSSTGSSARSTPRSRSARRDDRAHDRRHRAPADRRHRPPDGRKIQSRAPYASTSSASSRRRRAPAPCSRSTPRPTAATSTTSTRATRPPRA
jgi:DNA polymerase (family 10)